MSLPSLPNEIWLMIFSDVNDFNEILKFKLVCRHWNELIKNYRSKSLIFSSRYNSSTNFLKRLDPFDSKKWISFNDRFVTHKSFNTLLRSSSIKFMISNIEKLCFDRLDSYTVNNWSGMQSVLNQFRQLTYLHIDKVAINKSKQIKLNNVQILSIGQLQSSLSKTLTLDMCKLTKFHIRQFSPNIKFVHKSSITSLSFYLAHDLPDHLNHVEYLNLKCFDSKNAEMILIKFPNLKVLSVQEATKDSLIKFFKQKRIRRNLYVKVNLFGIFMLNDSNQLDEFFNESGWLLRLNTKTIIENYDKFVGTNHWNVELNLNQIINHFGHIPQDLNFKFTNIFKVIIDKPIHNRNELIKFFQNCLNIEHVKIHRTLFDQSFYDQLAKCLPESSHLSLIYTLNELIMPLVY